MPLTEYRRKRDFRRTPEPRGSGRKPAAGKRFVVQKHAARRLHYDFRLEMDGVLKSWAIPKGPSLDPSVKSLAVHVEDHPLEYAAFEGVIPKDEYGGGTVMVWDQGTWEAEGDPSDAYKEGRLKFHLNGEKLHGEWHLVRMTGRAGEDGKNWLLIKKDDPEARAADDYDVVTKASRSVLSGRDIQRIAADADRVWTNGKSQDSRPAARRKTDANKAKARSSKPRESSASGQKKRADPACVTGSKRAAQPKSLKPQLAMPSRVVPGDGDWLHEIKFDGYRILAFLADGRVRLLTRRGNNWTSRFPMLAQAIKDLPAAKAILDGEAVALEPDGNTNFQRLQNWMKRGRTDQIVYYAFDLLYLDGYDLMQTPLMERKELLERILLSSDPDNEGLVRYSDHILGHGSSVAEHACRQALEGVISKKADSVYEQKRSPQWRKVKCLKRQEFVIGGFTKPAGTRTGFGALLLGYHDGKALRYCGRVGTGFTEDSLRQLTTELKSRRTDAPPFTNPPSGSLHRGVTWVRPELVCEVEFTEWTEDDRLRHPSFQGLREDKPAGEVIREDAGVANGLSGGGAPTGSRPSRSASRPVARRRGTMSTSSSDSVAGVHLTNPGRVLYPEQGITKRDLAAFYESIAEWVLPYIVDRPLTLVRCPKGSGGHCFYQKHLTESMPAALRGVFIEEKKKREEYVVVDDLAGLISLVQMGVLEMHPWPARTDDLDHPDQFVFDLDPGEGTTWGDVVQGARDVRDRLGRHGLESFLRTSGGKGLHVVAPLNRRNTWDEFKEFAKSVAVEMENAAPGRYTSNMSKSKRRGKIFVDYLRNQRGATAIASYSTRAREGAPVATPVRWDELSPKLAADKYTVENLPRRLSSLKSDPWEKFFTMTQSIDPVTE
jgi:bifunctional non-homologous end joining protein LigD